MARELYILESDKRWARERIAALEKEIQELGPEFYDVFNQSSETWHDNAPFDALRDRQAVLFAELSNLKAILRDSLPSTPRLKKSTVGIGSVVADLGPVDILVNNAGITRDVFLHKMSLDQWQAVVR